MFIIEYIPEGSSLMPGIARSIEFFNKMGVQLAK
jgi:hypothetical protein